MFKVYIKYPTLNNHMCLIWFSHKKKSSIIKFKLFKFINTTLLKSPFSVYVH